jgi:hypothetical protein
MPGEDGQTIKQSSIELLGITTSFTKADTVLEKRPSRHEREIADLSMLLIRTLLDADNIDSPFVSKHLSPNAINATTDPDARWNARGRPAFLEAVRRYSARLPEDFFCIYDGLVVAEVTGNGRGVAWVPSSVCAILPGEEEGKVRREWVNRLKWRWAGNGTVGSGGNGRWVCEKVSSISTSGGFIGII